MKSLRQSAAQVARSLAGLGLLTGIFLVAGTSRADGPKASAHGGHLVAKTQALPPVGQRTYLLDKATPYAPVEIERSGQSAKRTVYLKDPVHLTGPITLQPPVKRQAPVKERPAAPRQVAGKMRFKSLAVDGHLKRPRVEFSRDVLPLERADEPVSQEFFQKVFAPATDDNF